MSKWISVKEQLPPDLEVVIARYEGFWHNRGMGGVTDLYVHAGKWFNHPETVKITHWLPWPETPDADR